MAQEINWHQGSLVTADHQVLIGEISIQTNELLLMRNDNQSNVYPVHKIQSVRFYDRDADINRKFIVLRNEETDFYQGSLYEIVVLGKLEIVRQQKSLIRGKISSDDLDFDYFIVREGSMTKLQNFRRKFYSQLMAGSGELQQFVKEEKLDPNSLADAIRIVMFYNSMILPPALASLQ